MSSTALLVLRPPHLACASGWAQSTKREFFARTNGSPSPARLGATQFMNCGLKGLLQVCYLLRVRVGDRSACHKGVAPQHYGSSHQGFRPYSGTLIREADFSGESRAFTVRYVFQQLYAR